MTGATDAEVVSLNRHEGLTRGRYRRWGPFILLLPAAILMIPIFFLPVVELLLTSVRDVSWTFSNYSRVLSEPPLWAVLWRTLEIAFEVSLICALIGYPIAYLILRIPSRWAQIAMILVSLPVWTSALVRSYAWMVLLGRGGPANEFLIWLGITSAPIQILYTRFAVVICLIHVLLPFAVFPILAVMRRIDDRLMAAGESLGARRWISFLLIFLPLSLPGVGSGFIIIFVMSIGYFVAPALLGGLGDTTYIMLIEQQITSLSNWGVASAMSVVLLLVTLAIVILFGRSAGLLRPPGDDTELMFRSEKSWFTRSLVRILLNCVVRRRRGGRKVEPRFIRIHASASRAGLAVQIIGWAAIVFVLLPILIFFPLSLSGNAYLEFPPSSYSLQWFKNYFSRSDWIEATVTSFEVALIVAVSATILGCITAIGVSRAKFIGGNLYLSLLISPAIIPTLIIAVALYFQFAKLQLIGSVTALVLAHLIIALPFVVILVLGALRRVDLTPEQAARSLGAGPIRAFVKTTLVLIRPSILVSGFVAFIVSFDDVIMALFLSGTTAITLPKRMWDGVRMEIDPTVAAVSSLLILLSLSLLLIAELTSARSSSRSQHGESASTSG